VTLNDSNSSDGGGLGPVVEIWIEDAPGGQALFVTTTATTGEQSTAALRQPTEPFEEQISEW